jgi:hypothetical protein
MQNDILHQCTGYKSFILSSTSVLFLENNCALLGKMRVLQYSTLVVSVAGLVIKQDASSSSGIEGLLGTVFSNHPAKLIKVREETICFD